MSGISNNIRTFTPASFTNALHDNEELVIPENKIVLFNEAQPDECFQAKMAFSLGDELPDVVSYVFQKMVGENAEKVKFGTLGVWAGGVSPEKGEFGIVSSEPFYISLHHDIIFKVRFTELFDKMMRRSMPNSVFIQPDQKLLLKDILVPIQQQPNEDISPETRRAFYDVIAAIADAALRSLSPEEFHELSNCNRNYFSCSFADRWVKIEGTPEGTLLSSENGFEIKGEWVERPRPVFNLLFAYRPNGV